MLRRLAFTGLALLAIAACSTATPQPVVTITSSPSGSRPAIRQYVSIVAILKAKIATEQDGLRNCPQSENDGRLFCGARANHAAFAAANAWADMNRLGGEPPTEVASLVKQTMDAAQAVVLALPAPETCNLTASDSCDQYEDVQRDNVDNLVAILAGWDAYE